VISLLRFADAVQQKWLQNAENVHSLKHIFRVKMQSRYLSPLMCKGMRCTGCPVTPRAVLSGFQAYVAKQHRVVGFAPDVTTSTSGAAESHQSFPWNGYRLPLHYVSPYMVRIGTRGAPGSGVRFSSSRSVDGGQGEGQDKEALEEELASRTRIWTVPNALTALRIVASPGIAWLISTGQFQAAFYSLWFAGALDWADGLIARKFKGQASLLGSFLDPLADKVLVACTGLSMAFAGVLHPALIFVVVGRDVLLVAGSLMYRYHNRSKDEKFFSLSNVSYKVEPSFLSKINTTLQIGLVVTAIAQAAWPQFSFASLDLASMPLDAASLIPESWFPSSPAAASSIEAVATNAAPVARPTVLPLTLKPVVDCLSWVVGGTTIWTGLDYLFRGGFGKLKLAAQASSHYKRAGELLSQAQGRAQQQLSSIASKAKGKDGTSQPPQPPTV
jgi:phosphatidylglycerophosphate synthase